MRRPENQKHGEKGKKKFMHVKKVVLGFSYSFTSTTKAENGALPKSQIQSINSIQFMIKKSSCKILNFQCQKGAQLLKNNRSDS